MRIGRFVAIAAGVAFMALAGAGSAEARNVSATSDVNMRIGPGAHHDRVGKMHRGQRGRLLRCNYGGNWCLIDARRGPTGWVNARYLRRAGGGGGGHHHGGGRVCFYGAGGYICFGS